ncbi:MAG: TVP38/TMEM64 family protein, partial [Thermodesulfobacteriota bacterium]
PIPGEATGFLGGYLFGVAYGFLLSMVGLAIGSIIAFLLGRWLEIHFVEKIVSPETLAKFDFIVERQGALITFLLFLIPGFPKDYLSFIMGLSKMPLRLFLIIATVGRIPGTLLLTLQGANVYEGNYIRFFIMLGIFLVVGLLGFVYKETIYLWLRRWSKRNAKAAALEKGRSDNQAIGSP